MCFGIRKSTPFHLATLILPIQNQKHPKNVKNACKFILFSHHQFNIRVCYVHAVLLHVKYYYAILLHVKYATMFILWTVVFHFHLFGQFSTDSERNQFSRYPPFAPITLCALPSKDSAHLLFNSNEFFSSLIWHFVHLRSGWSTESLATSWSRRCFNWSMVCGRGEKSRDLRIPQMPNKMAI